MFALIATVCLSADVSSCASILWQKNFDTNEACVEASAPLIADLQSKFFFVNGGCFTVIEKPNV